MLSEEETQEIKQKLIEQVETSFPEEQKQNARSQIEAMNSQQLESFLQRNKMIKEQTPKSESSESECVFCSIVSDRIKSIKIAENRGAIAVLEINPISKGHSLVIPKKHSNKASKTALRFAEKVSKILKEKLYPKLVEISTSKLFGHEIINVLPVYNKESFNSERKPVRIEELEKIKEELEKRKERKKRYTKEIRSFWLPRRIP